MKDVDGPFANLLTILKRSRSTRRSLTPRTMHATTHRRQPRPPELQKSVRCVDMNVLPY